MLQGERSPQTPEIPPRPSVEKNNDHTRELPVNKVSGMKGMIQKVNPFRSTSQSKAADEQRVLDTEQNPGVFKTVIQKVNPFRSASQTQSPVTQVEEGEHAHTEIKPENKQNPGVFKTVIQKVNPFKSASQTQSPVTQVVKSDVSGSDSLNNNHTQVTMGEGVTGGAVKNEQPVTQKKEKGVVKVRIRNILPGALFGSARKDSEQEALSETEECPLQDGTVEMEMVPVSNDGDVLENEEEDALMEWWRSVEGWNEWNENSEFQEDEELAAEQAADRVYMAARLFVHLFNQRGASLQQRILELLSLADAADSFHKRTVTASVGGGVASVAGSVTTITGLILAPFTFGTSIIVTAVGIGVATAGGLTSASANITDTVHSNTDRKKVESMIEQYQEEMKDIRECLEFVQEGMTALEQWNFEQYKESVSKQAMNQNVRHVMKEGGRAGKALMVNTESLISTVQVFSVAGGAAKAAQAISVTTGVMSGLFLALDLFFLAKDSNELRKGAKTQFAAKIREVCKELQEGLLELNRIKADLQRTMDGIVLEEEEEEEGGGGGGRGGGGGGGGGSGISSVIQATKAGGVKHYTGTLLREH
ncbi:hypothetical protein AGOR_G00187630 [Albula goreensis]|uniref:Uncharacterized protein n=1 Tax=Albula goreensis TaxID=1534307 RepID=A0A8T3CY61_9TELE|nr:hypothetical protein AGOR_G00187630 [Albula goreensis]